MSCNTCAREHKMHTKLFSENLKETGHLEDPGVGRRITHAP